MIKRKPKKLAHEILGLLAVTGVLSLLLLELLIFCGVRIIDQVLDTQNIELTIDQLYLVDSWTLNISLLITVVFFVVLFLYLLGERLSYIRDILAGIDALQQGKQDHVVPLTGNNELTRLAASVNYLSASQRQIKEKERLLNEEKDQFIHAISHDIRTPLTSILSYSELLCTQTDCSPAERQEYLARIRKKAGQIKEISDLLLDGSRRSPEYFEDARLLMAQLAEEFETDLEDDYTLAVDLAACPAFSGTFDVQELRRIFDNLISNIRKYADPAHPVSLSIGLAEHSLIIRQENRVINAVAGTESHQIGLRSIRRICHNYGGRAAAHTQDNVFSITITLSEF